jgi:hypothetical protein
MMIEFKRSDLLNDEISHSNMKWERIKGFLLENLKRVYVKDKSWSG